MVKKKRKLLAGKGEGRRENIDEKGRDFISLKKKGGRVYPSAWEKKGEVIKEMKRERSPAEAFVKGNCRRRICR